jgi:hypothetical protein
MDLNYTPQMAAPIRASLSPSSLRESASANQQQGLEDTSAATNGRDSRRNSVSSSSKKNDIVIQSIESPDPASPLAASPATSTPVAFRRADSVPWPTSLREATPSKQGERQRRSRSLGAELDCWFVGPEDEEEVVEDDNQGSHQQHVSRCAHEQQQQYTAMASWVGQPSVKGGSELVRMILLNFTSIGITYVSLHFTMFDCWQ